ncbi:hypothetical protein CAI21_07810 [Alkalilimnicola ehrlichii]|uniref:DUF1449 domain-containing protein n=1 Tax=Alkalilimnicola ehrlichii TaxID=351052 RepID=A0A3E0WWU3_9GAMM|nr:OB-fold-containig protein [Alkalilimnicola ehrlichii]RFA30097.1 hypothetical protein CAI21_07810 [Alkalilimnicola ehrlichii]RFA37442.1 hypothetical protein CAL65_09150 [Alkalilimnicola ehrlichii]
MVEYFSLITSFPTAPFTLLLALCVLYWLCVMLGALDVELIPVDAIDGIEESLSSGLAGLLSAIAVRGVPMTIVLSFAVLWAWMLSALVHGNILLHLPDWLQFGLGVVTFFAALVGGLILGKLSSRPMKKLFVQGGAARTNRELVGQVCEIQSGQADEQWGEARFAEDGSVLILPVRTVDGQVLTRGQRALIIDYCPEQKIYLITAGE